MKIDNVIPIRSRMPTSSEIGGVLPPGWILRPPRHTAPQEPFALAIQAKMQHLVAEAARTNWIDGYWRGTFGMLPFVGVGCIVGFLCGWAFT